MTECHKRDGAAVIAFLAWLQDELVNKHNTTLDEFSVCEKLEQFRRMQKWNLGLSFETISSVGPNAAVVHYKPEPETALKLEVSKIYLLDSGGQYWDGTTDITRTHHFGEPTADEKDAYTRVLLGNLDLERVVFPANSKYSGADFDVLARRWLWEVALDFGHGTGHGVGYCLNVHEGPHGISKYRTFPLQEGMFVSDGKAFLTH